MNITISKHKDKHNTQTKVFFELANYVDIMTLRGYLEDGITELKGKRNPMYFSITHNE